MRGAAAANKALVRKLFDEVFNGGRLELLDELIAVGYAENNPAPGQGPGAAGVRGKIEALRTGFPDVRFVLDELVGEGAIVAARYHWQGTHTGPFLGMPGTGKKVVVAGMDFYRFAEGRLAEHWETVDEFGLLAQLGELA